MANLLIIGNGFDLAHDLKTSYSHFIRYIIEEKLIDNNKFKELVLDLKNLTYDSVIKKVRNGDTFFHDNFPNLLFRGLLRNEALYNWCDIEAEYFKHLNNIGEGKGNKYYNSAKKLNYDFDVLKKYLEKYLIDQEKYFSKLKVYSDFFNSINKKDTVILNFNYTRCLKKYISNDYQGKVINIHGELENEDNPIIFGYAADKSETKQFLGYGKEYIRNIKKHCYKITDNRNKLKEYLDKTKNIEVSILGHSCGISDKLILFEIFSHDNVSKIRIFHHENYENYLNTQANITSITKDDEEIFDKLINYDKKMTMPQKEDKSYNLFIEYIKSMIEEQNIIKRKSTKKIRGC